MTNEKIAEARRLRDEGKSYRAIADVMGVSPPVIRRNLVPEARGKNRLRGARYRKMHKEKERLRYAKYREDNKEKERLRHAKYREEHVKQRRAYNVQYYKDHGIQFGCGNPAVLPQGGAAARA